MTQIDLENISTLIVDGFKSGYYPTWNLLFSNIETENVTQNSLKHVAKQISSGFLSGEIIEDDNNSDNNGWWELL